MKYTDKYLEIINNGDAAARIAFTAGYIAAMEANHEYCPIADHDFADRILQSAITSIIIASSRNDELRTRSAALAIVNNAKMDEYRSIFMDTKDRVNDSGEDVKMTGRSMIMDTMGNPIDGNGEAIGKKGFIPHREGVAHNMATGEAALKDTLPTYYQYLQAEQAHLVDPDVINAVTDLAMRAIDKIAEVYKSAGHSNGCNGSCHGECSKVNYACTDKLVPADASDDFVENTAVGD